MLGQGLNSLIPGSDPEPLLPEHASSQDSSGEEAQGEERKQEPTSSSAPSAVPFDLLPRNTEEAREVMSENSPTPTVESSLPEGVVPPQPPTPEKVPAETLSDPKEASLASEIGEEAPQIEATFAVASTASSVLATPAVSPLPQPEPKQERENKAPSTSEPSKPFSSSNQQTKDLSRLFKVEEVQKNIKPSDFIYHIELSKIVSNPDQPRRMFNEEGIRDLANSIREFGILQPIVVTKHEKEIPSGTDVEYELISGERRVLACRYLGLERIPAIIRNVKLERERLELAVIENIQRENLNPIETARAFARLQDEFRLTQREIAARLGKSREVVANTLRLLDLPPYIVQSVEAGQISESHARLLLSVPDPASQERLFTELINTRVTTRELRKRVKDLSVQQGTLKGIGINETPEMKMAAERLSQELGTPVSIDATSGKGKITINFYSEEELKSLVAKLANHLETGDF